MSSIEAKKTVVHALTLAFGFAPVQNSIRISYFSDDNDNGSVAVDFSVCDIEYALVYVCAEYQLTRKDFYGYGHDLTMTFFNE